jgi:REP element-mobilizing transposase RayT
MQVVEWVDIFTRQRYRNIVIDSLNFCIDNKGLEVYAYVIMSNHIHILARAANNDLSEVVRDFKRHTSRMIIKSMLTEPESRAKWMLDIFKKAASEHSRNELYQVWTHENHAEEIYSPAFTLQKIKYIHDNPVRAGIVTKAEDYMYSSARNYSGKDNLINVTKIKLSLLMS